MSRPHLEFIQAQVLPWQPTGANGWHDATETKVLSSDADTGAHSVLRRYPAGWRHNGQVALDVDEEFFVLSGALTIGTVTYGEYAYGHLPKGFLRGAAHCAEPTVVLTFLSGPAHAAAAKTDTCDKRRLVEKIDALSTPFSTDFAQLGVRSTPDASIRPSIAAFLLLRDDPDTHEQTWLLSARGMRNGTKQEIHPVAEEMFFLGGDLVGPYGLMRTGAYFWRPPGLGHGPFGSKSGSLLFNRTQGGALRTEYAAATEDFAWTRPYRPVLPPSLEHYRDASVPDVPAY